LPSSLFITRKDKRNQGEKSRDLGFTIIITEEGRHTSQRKERLQGHTNGKGKSFPQSSGSVNGSMQTKKLLR